jgi:hypothetical protein
MPPRAVDLFSQLHSCTLVKRTRSSLRRVLGTRFWVTPLTAYKTFSAGAGYANKGEDVGAVVVSDVVVVDFNVGRVLSLL